ncbi:glutathione S-transferase family protein [Paragemmobacter straminiformis]|uniref:Glutathione S-transferase family protein n=1 Tax=Paragemmobacter straminiformis TaxID=2045119 RepID=A0A842I4V2_9RHOB|nr:glutathione S-transferase family protein [Gemmobacter straminiformis]MBC2834639.1 glutathione S-transferase family protein [Gemmobacter straminiformis]
MPAKPIIYHIPVCPFSQRVEIVLELKGLRDAVTFQVVDITKPREAWLLEKTRGTTALPVLEDEQGRILKESLVLMAYFDERYPEVPVARTDPYERAVERLFTTREGPFGNAGYGMVMNRDRAKIEERRKALLDQYAWLDEGLRFYNPEGTFLFDRFGWAEAVYTPLMMRFWFLDHYEGFTLPDDPAFARVARWKAACLSHPAAQQVQYDEIVKLYYDYAAGAGNGALPAGRMKSSFTFAPHWRDRPMPPTDKYDRIATDAELGLV